MIITNNRNKKDIPLLLSLILVIVFPLLPTYFGNNSFHIIPITLILSLFLIYRKQSKTILDKGLIKPIVFFFTTFFLLLLSLITDSFIIPEVGIKDYIGILKPIYLYIYFLVGYSFIVKDDKKIYTITLVFEILIILSFVIAVLEVFYIKETKQILYFLYKRQERTVLIDKATGWFGVTYYFSYFMSLLCFYSFFMLTKKRSLFYFFTFIFAFLTMLLTQSRTLILGLIFGFIILPFLKHSFKNKALYLYYCFIFVLLLFLALYYSDFIEKNFGYLYSGITNLFESGVNVQGSKSSSPDIRISQFWWAWDNNKYKLIGYGLARNGEVFLESVYAYYMYRFGILYLIFFIFLLIYFFKISSKLAVIYRKNTTYYSFFSALSMFYIISPIALFASASHEMPKIAFVIFICSGIVYKFNLETKKYG